MPCAKIAISLRQPLLERADRLARKLKISRSRLFAQAVEEFLNRYSDRELLDRITTASEG
jgi:metal-responsive CopG/Arc/MetJ family transcriptional regulator